MKDIILLGKTDDLTTDHLFINFFAKHYSVTYINKDTFCRKGIGNELLIYSSTNPLITNSSKSILVFKNNYIPTKDKFNTNNCVTVVSSENLTQLDFLLNNDIPALTCGKSPKDTITFSSISDDTIMISLQREIINFNNNKIFPCEVPFTLQFNKVFPHLACFAAAVEIGLYDKNYL